MNTAKPTVQKPHWFFRIWWFRIIAFLIGVWIGYFVIPSHPISDVNIVVLLIWPFLMFLAGHGRDYGFQRWWFGVSTAYTIGSVCAYLIYPLFN